MVMRLFRRLSAGMKDLKRDFGSEEELAAFMDENLSKLERMLSVRITSQKLKRTKRKADFSPRKKIFGSRHFCDACEL